MTTNTPAPIDRDATKTNAAALMVLGAHTPEDAAVIAGMTPDALFDYAERNEPDVARQAIELRRKGVLVESHAMGALEEVVRQLEEKLQTEKMQALTLAKLAETLMRLAGLAEKRAADIKPPERTGEALSIHIILPGHSEQKIVLNPTRTPDAIEVEGEVVE